MSHSAEPLLESAAKFGAGTNDVTANKEVEVTRMALVNASNDK